MPMTLGYWDIRGLAHGIRLLLEYTDTSYEEKRYTMGDAPDYDQSQWLSEKFKLGLDFPNLPYLIDGTHKLTQSNAILRYLARKHGLCGETEEERIRVDILENQLMDTRMLLATLCYSPDFEKLKPGYLQELPEKLRLLSQFLGKRPWFAGDKITFVDFIAYDVIERNRVFDPRCLDAFPNLKDFIARFEGLEKISAYMKSSRFLPRPVFMKNATWGNKPCVLPTSGCVCPEDPDWIPGLGALALSSWSPALKDQHYLQCRPLPQIYLST
ncbi:glutathione S-transferase Mu 7 isoform X3 [Lepus europaeus]|uniref:glutathione S-transferase Mu 7 isoform X3 n=1 Tax=Lepus europaeus TaxID=9983 RepID=UPI002B47B82F|nr:glutathione S-transferase Mu 7 isoform X3 [Lepus europaeus]